MERISTVPVPYVNDVDSSALLPLSSSVSTLDRPHGEMRRAPSTSEVPTDDRPKAAHNNVANFAA